MMASVKIDSLALRRFLYDPSGPIIRRISRVATDVAVRAGTLARRRSGTLHSNIRIEYESAVQNPFYRVVADVPYAMAEHEGVRPHIIRASNRAALHFNWERRGGLETVVPRQGGFRTHISSGGILFIGKGHVDHPGTEGSHFLVRALEDATRGGIA